MRIFKCGNSSVSWPLCDRDERSDVDDLVLDLGPAFSPVRYHFHIASYLKCIMRNYDVKCHCFHC